MSLTNKWLSLGFSVIILKIILSTEEDTKNWKNGFEFSLPSIMQKKEFRRSDLINDIKSKLKSQAPTVVSRGVRDFKKYLFTCGNFDGLFC